MDKFKDRLEAGRKLADALVCYKDKKNTLILALPRGGVPVAFEVARELHLPLDIYLVKKLGVPGYEELAMGAIANGNIIFFNKEIIDQLLLMPNQINTVIAKEKRELARRSKLYRSDMPLPEMKDKNIILIDDGLATGATMQAAIEGIKEFRPLTITIAVPVGAQDVCTQLKNTVDDLVCMLVPHPFYSVGAWYEDFSQTTDDEVITLLKFSKSFSSADQDA